ncbi:hypothetical protein L1987_78866 [Smallanthus sonchifolius]|uniref:Uncharacterized protein n=1 Tax=Smallanthus sonchifolius TaxID=185202 RepID=A0ACB8ZE26_9ASTR|nr:hypothetical protein L1987_78866 [Smallanthus sonchifolius]
MDGKIDAFIPNKRDSSRGKFGFVRFENVKNVGLLEKALNGLKLRGLKISANVAKFDKVGNRVASENNPFRGGGHPKNTNHYQEQTQAQVDMPQQEERSHPFGKASFKEALVNNNIGPVIKLIEESELARSWVSLSLVGEVIDMKVLCDLKNRLNGLVNSCMELRYLWGMKVVLTFKSTVAANQFLQDKKEEYDLIFKSLTLWDGQIIPYDRIAWVHIHGVPIHLWEGSTFDRRATNGKGTVVSGLGSGDVEELGAGFP